jgi:hypothetical protein
MDELSTVVCANRVCLVNLGQKEAGATASVSNEAGGQLPSTAVWKVNVG